MHISEPKELVEIKNRYANILIKTLAIAGLFALAASLWQIYFIGWHGDNIIGTFSYVIILFLYLFRNKIPVKVKIGVIVIFAYLIGTTGLLVNSIIGMFLPYYIFGALFTMLFFDNKKTIWVVTIEGITFITIFLLKTAGIVTFFGLDPYYRAFSNNSWLNYIFTFLLFIILILIFSRKFYDILFSTIQNLNELNSKLLIEIASKENAFEEIAATEEELKTTNDELVNVNAELSTKNNELISTLWKLQENETRFKTLFEMASDAFLILKGEEVIDCNNAAESIFKLSKQEIIGKTPYDLSPEVQRDGISSDIKTRVILDKVARTKKPILFEWEHLKGNNEIFNTQINLNYFVINKEPHFHAIVRDITYQKKYERNLIESENKFKKLFEFNPAAISLSKFDKGLRYIDVNSSFEKLIHLPKNEIINKTIYELGFDVDTNLYGQLRKELKSKGFFESKEIILNSINGNPVTCLVSGIMVTIMNEPLVMTISIDITDQKQIQNKLKQYQNYLEEIVNERTSEIQALNSELFKTNKELIDSNEELSQQKEELASIIEKLQQTQAKLVQSEKMASLGVLTSGIAHEINNPINFISSGAYGLQILIHSLIDFIKKTDCYINKKYLDSPEVGDSFESIDEIMEGSEKLIENIQQGIDRANSIIQSLKTFTYKGTGTKEPFDIHSGLNSTLVMVNHLVKNRIEIIKDYGEIPLIPCQSGQINQVFMNLIHNAIDAIKDKGTITIKTRISNDSHKLIISIADTGNGIPDNIKQHIFEPFFTTKEVGKGTGLGLSISYNIIKEHGGELHFTSEIGKGSIFFIELPISENS